MPTSAGAGSQNRAAELETSAAIANPRGTESEVHPMKLYPSYQTPTGVSNPQIDETATGWFESASQPDATPSPVIGITAGAQAGFSALYNGQPLTPAITQAITAESMTGTGATDCVAVVSAICGVFSQNLSLWGNIYNMGVNTGLIVVANNTVYEVFNSPQPQYEQIYVNRGWIPICPSGVLPPVPAPPNQNISLGLFGVAQIYTSGGTFNPAGDYGPSGAIWMQILDVNTGNVLGALCIAYSFPLTGSNSCQVTFNPSSISDFFNNFNSGPAALTGTANLPAQTINGTSYPALTASCALDSPSGSQNTIAVYLAAS